MRVITVAIYRFFKRRRGLFYAILLLSSAIMLYFASKIELQENIYSFFQKSGKSEEVKQVFENLRVKDKIFILFSHSDIDSPDNSPDSLISAATLFAEKFPAAEGGLYKTLTLRPSVEFAAMATDMIYDNLPIYLQEEDYKKIDSLLTGSALSEKMRRNFYNLISPAGFALKEHIAKDPLGIASSTLKKLENLKIESDYRSYNGYLFSDDLNTLIIYLEPLYELGNIGENEKLISAIETALKETSNEFGEVDCDYYGGPSVAVYNARRIKADTLFSSVIALAIIFLFILVAFKNRFSIFLLLLPLVYGLLFALMLIYFIQGGISSIAIGAGSAVLGIALSYSIHLLAHQNHVSDIETLIKEVTYPLTIGSFTTIGAFAGLLFTSSDLLSDFGLFASLSLVGTTLFCLLFLPQFLSARSHIKPGRLLSFIGRVNSFNLDKKRSIAVGIVALFILSLIMSSRVGFNGDMMSLNYEPDHLIKAQKRLMPSDSTKFENILFVSRGSTFDSALSACTVTDSILNALVSDSYIQGYASMASLFIPEVEQRRRIDLWNNYWSATKKEELREKLTAAAQATAFAEGSFNRFFDLLDRDFVLCDYKSERYAPFTSQWLTSVDSLYMFVSQARLSKDDKEKIYSSFESAENSIVFDRGFFTNLFVDSINDDFNLILAISSVIVFIALLISYGRIELALMSFMPMCVSWVIIVGLMGLFGLEFNIVNIILATFIFGIGDDFSIFIMDGLINKSSKGHELLNAHKVAIFFSAFTIIVGTGALCWAKHPALHSISLIALFGIVTVVVVAYTLLPLLYNIFIANPIAKGLPPYTLVSLLRSAVVYTLFFLGCVVISIVVLISLILPFRRVKKQLFVNNLMRVMCKFILQMAFFAKKRYYNPTGETFRKSAIIVANHQSFIDILQIIANVPKVVLVTNRWVWNSPFFGAVIRYAGYYFAGNGYENSVGFFREKVSQGYSIAIFPEGTRSITGQIKRFHKGAFYLQSILGLDIVPVLLHGNRDVISKVQPFNVQGGVITFKILPRIAPDNSSYSQDYALRSKEVCSLMRKEYALLERQSLVPDNFVLRNKLVINYIYKSPVIEWYVKVKVRMEKSYSIFNELLPLEGKITDIGCGMGLLPYMLHLLSPERELLGIDYDRDKIDIASCSYLKSPMVRFIQANATECELPQSDAFIISDMLHYMNYAKQSELIAKCMNRLKEGGVIIIRDGNSDKAKKQRVTEFTELLSTKVFHFNKTESQLYFLNTEEIRKVAEKHDFSVESIDNDNITSNTIYILRRRVVAES